MLVAPRLSALAVQVLQFLHLPQESVDQLVADELRSNPLLVRGPPRRCRWCSRPLSGERCPACDGDLPLHDELVADTDARDAVRQQARHLVPRGCEAAVDFVIDCLDDRGLLPGGIDALVGAGPRRDAVTAALRAVMEAGPPGTATRGLQECLVAQAKWHSARGGPPLLVPLVREHLSAIGVDHAAAAAALGVSTSDVDAAVRYLRTRLISAPLPRARSLPRGAPPDVVLRRSPDGSLRAVVLTAADLGLEVDSGLPEVSGADAAWLAQREQRARALLDLLDRRASGLQRIAQYVATHQQQFVLQGPGAHRSLTRTQVAKALDLHPSTVSRAVRGAVVALPDGRTLALAGFFGTAVSTRAALLELLEGATAPHSDAEAAARLTAAGHRVARRTVAKYRAQLSVSPSRPAQ